MTKYDEDIKKAFDILASKIDYNYMHCSCGGIIGMYDRENFTCGNCGKEFKLHECSYSELKINDKTGWIFPVRYKFLDN